MNKIVLASNNKGKLSEFSQLLAPLHIQVLPQVSLNIPECPEPYITFVENALAKARHASAIAHLPALADDSGICAVALNGKPGVYSARYAGETPKSDIANNLKLNQDLATKANKSVYYVCVLVLLRAPDDPNPIITEATWSGIWHSQAKGANGFGYDPHFYIPEQGKTAAELSKEMKNKISHRAQAIRLLMDRLTQDFFL